MRAAAAARGWSVRTGWASDLVKKKEPLKFFWAKSARDYYALKVIYDLSSYPKLYMVALCSHLDFTKMPAHEIDHYRGHEH